MSTEDKQIQIDAAKQLQLDADRYAIDKGLLPDGSLLFTTAAEGYEAGYAAARAASGVSSPGGEAGGALPDSLRASLLRELSRMVSESEANELRSNGGHGDFDAGAGQGRAFLAAEILAAFPTPPTHS